MRRIPFFLLILAAALTGQEPRTEYYLLEATMQSPDGRPYGSSVSLIKRVVDRDKARIDESVVSLRGTDPAQETITTIRPDGNRASITTDDGAFSGTAELSGPAWEWTGMKFSGAFLKTRLNFEGEDLFTPTGMSAEKRMLASDGKPRILIHEKGNRITRATYEALRARLLPKP